MNKVFFSIWYRVKYYVMLVVFVNISVFVEERGILGSRYKVRVRRFGLRFSGLLWLK